MTPIKFISYAQNFEDLMIWRALSNVSEGFYIDVGAWSPEVDSVTKNFYDKGWHGINIDPSDEFEELYKLNRPRDVFLKIGIGESDEILSLYHFPETGLSTFDIEIANLHIDAGLAVEVLTRQIKTLNSIFENYVGEHPVHFMKIDVEGFETSVIKGNDWIKNRPWLLVIEATRPNSTIENFHEWEPILLEADYSLVYKDGLNRFYLSLEHHNLAVAFNYPPNILDNFQTRHEAELIKMVHESEADRLARGHQIEELTKMVHESEADRLARGHQIEELTKMVHESEKRNDGRQSVLLRLKNRWYLRFLNNLKKFIRSFLYK